MDKYPRTGSIVCSVWNVTILVASSMNCSVLFAFLAIVLRLPTYSQCAIAPPYVLDSDLSTCECYQEELYPEACPRMTPQLPDLCDDLQNVEYNSTKLQVQQFCSASCLHKLEACYEENKENGCTPGIFTYYNRSFCSADDESGKFCVSKALSLIRQLPDIGINQCSDANAFCTSCRGFAGFFCKIVLNEIVSELGCCARSLFHDPHSPFAEYAVTNVDTYSNCRVSLGMECPYVAPSDVGSTRPDIQ